MYEYRNFTPEERAQVIEDRKRHGFPSHAPPHPVRDRTQYLITAACYEHVCLMTCAERRQQLLDLIFEVFISTGVDILAWVVLPNHYHLLLDLPNFDQLGRLVRSCHGPTARWWNLEDGQTGRKVWFRYTDRAIRSERHYYTTLNYCITIRSSTGGRNRRTTGPRAACTGIWRARGASGCANCGNVILCGTTAARGMSTRSAEALTTNLKRSL